MIEFLPWDSQFFGRRIGRLSRAPQAAPEWQIILEEARSQSLDCIYLLLDADDAAGIRSAQCAGFQMVDIRMTLVRELHGELQPFVTIPPGAILRRADEKDLPALQAIARLSHTDTRFFADPHFDPARSAEMYAVWIAKSLPSKASLEDPSGVVWIPEIDTQPCGYLTCRLEDDLGQIGLVGITQQARGQGLGLALLQTALDWFQAAGARRVQVVTQGRNLPALHLYQRGGFEIEKVQLWFHKWFIAEAR